MKKRASVVLDVETYERLQHRARQRGHTVSDEIRAAVDEVLAAEGGGDSPATGALNPNEGWADLLGIIDSELPDVPPAGSPEFKPWLRASVADDSWRGMGRV